MTIMIIPGITRATGKVTIGLNKNLEAIPGKEISTRDKSNLPQHFMNYVCSAH